ncbi:MAG: ATP-dependent DNA helicase RecG [Sulfurovum sp.]|nr:ATP-dependent DNA helicase RecG [Sulfurovum sp.]
MENDKEKFKKLKISTLLDLALIVPTSYNNTTLSLDLKVGEFGTFEATVENVNTHNGKLNVTFFLPKFSKKISSIFFRATPYHYQLFTKESKHYIQGKLEQYKGYLQMSQPKSIKEIGKIIPKYKSVLKQSELVELVSKYVNEKNLYADGLDSLEVVTVMNLHFPKEISHIMEEKHFKQRVIQQLKFIEAFNHVKKLRGKRTDYPAVRLLDGDISSFTSSLPFSLTKEQQTVIEDIQKDLSREDKAAKRMVVGDVGSGKTMVILASVMMALPHKSILMAPTSLLALQLYEEAQKHLSTSVKIVLVMQGRDSDDYTDADFIIGTHALLYKDDLPEASLVMVDEQHRFGTRQRASLEALVSNGEKRPHFLQFSATPIPRTQAMMQSELLDVSLITTTPFERELKTQMIGKQDFPALLTHIEKEISCKHQVLIIYPLVEESVEVPYQSLEESKGFWREKFDNVYVTHGKDKQKEEVLLEFREKGDMLLATTVVEVGISLPRLTLIVIVGAERLGLATLHQLRGRVGRNGLKSWCYLFSHFPKSERLQRFCETDNGFDIAKLDLKFRDSGDILDGTIQSGQKFKWLDMTEDEEVIERAKSRIVGL